MSLLQPRRFRVFSFSLYCVFFSVAASAQLNTQSLPNGARAGLLIQSLNNAEPSERLQTGEYFPPASTLKVITALASQLELGPDFRFETTLAVSGNNAALVFSGDPTLKTDDVKTLLRALKQQQGSTITGDLWLDNRRFTGYERAVGWPWDVMGVCYSAPVSTINLDGNCIQASIYTQDDGRTRVFVPEHYPVHVISEAHSVSDTEQQSQHCDLELTTSPENHYRLAGCLPTRTKPLPLKFAVQNTDLYAQRLVYKLLNQLGITLKGEVRIGALPGKTAQVIATHQSESLTQLLDTMLKDSDNLIADTLTKTLGHHFFLQPGSFTNGTEAIKQIIFARTGISLADAQLTDGSGLSRNNRIRLDSMRQILIYVWQHDQELGLINLLPVAGESGTLKYRRSMRSDEVKGKIKGKSGSLYGTHNVVGFGLDKQGKPETLFIQYVTDYFPSESQTELPVEAPITQFESGFYHQVLSLSQAHDSQQ
ncbi:serine-type D-Ala-D-Ala carboxypeptidase [Vibrio fluvialis]|nr:serine-type D-Ala-D-Ala carboxypeptidase [Vibrio fluvialis]